MATVKSAAKTLHRADRRTAHHAAKARNTPAMRAAAIVADGADQPPLILLSSAVLVAGLVARRRTVAEAGARMLASHLIATAIKTAIKHRVDRTRPQAVEEGQAYTLKPGDSDTHDASSFPSGHTAGAVAVARAAARVWPEATPALAVAAAGVGALQLPTGHHYGSDVIAGAAIGLVGEALADAAFRAVFART